MKTLYKDVEKSQEPFKTKAYLALQGYDLDIYDRIDELLDNTRERYGVDLQNLNLIVDLKNGWIMNRKTGSVQSIDCVDRLKEVDISDWNE